MSSRLAPRWFVLALVFVFAPFAAMADTLSFVDADGHAVSVYPEGGTVVLRLELDQAQAAVTSSVTLTSTLGSDLETVTLVQVGATGKLFEGSIPLDPGARPPPTACCRPRRAPVRLRATRSRPTRACSRPTPRWWARSPASSTFSATRPPSTPKATTSTS